MLVDVINGYKFGRLFGFDDSYPFYHGARIARDDFKKLLLNLESEGYEINDALFFRFYNQKKGYHPIALLSVADLPLQDFQYFLELDFIQKYHLRISSCFGLDEKENVCEKKGKWKSISDVEKNVNFEIYGVNLIGEFPFSNGGLEIALNKESAQNLVLDTISNFLNPKIMVLR